MTPENQKKYDEKVARVEAAIALKEPDRVPITPSADIFPILNAGYTVGEVIYDTSLQKMKNAVVKYLNDFDPDKTGGVGMVYAGEGPMLELERPKNMRWAGMPGDIIDINSLQQHIEYPTLLDDEYDEFFSDRTGWTLRKQTPRNSGLLGPLTDLLGGSMMSARGIAAKVSSPEFKAMLEDLWKINELNQMYQAGVKDINDTCREMGLYPIQWDVDSLDWKNLSATEIAMRIINSAKNGSIILCHNNGLHTAKALPLIFSTLKNRGFTFVPISELIYTDDYYIDHNGRQHKNG